MSGLNRVFQSDSKSIDQFFLPQRWCSNQWERYQEPLKGTFSEKSAEVAKRIALFIPLMIATIGAFIIGAVGYTIDAIRCKIFRKSAKEVLASLHEISKGTELVTSFNKAVEADLLASLNKLLENEQTFTKEASLQTLNKAFVLNKKFMDLGSVRSEKAIDKLFYIVSRCGIITYPQFDKARIYLLTSLQMLLQSTGHITKQQFGPYTTLADIEKNPPNFDRLLKFIKKLDANGYLQITKKMNDDQKIQFGRTLTRLYETLTHVHGKDKLGLNDHEYLRFKTELTKGIIKVFESVSNRELVKGHLGEVQYNFMPGLYLAKCKLEKGTNTKEDILRSLEILDDTLKYNSSLSMKARIANLKFCRLTDLPEFKNDDKATVEQAKKLVLDSIDMWDEVFENAQNLTEAEKQTYQKLQSNANGNYLYFLLNAKDGATIEEMEKYVPFSIDFVAKNQERDPYTMIHLNKLAFFEAKKGNKDQAIAYLNEVKRVAAFYPNWADTTELLKSAEKIMKMLN